MCFYKRDDHSFVFVSVNSAVIDLIIDYCHYMGGMGAFLATVVNGAGL